MGRVQKVSRQVQREFGGLVEELINKLHGTSWKKGFFQGKIDSHERDNVVYRRWIFRQI